MFALNKFLKWTKRTGFSMPMTGALGKQHALYLCAQLLTGMECGASFCAARKNVLPRLQFPPRRPNLLLRYAHLFSHGQSVQKNPWACLMRWVLNILNTGKQQNISGWERKQSDYNGQADLCVCLNQNMSGTDRSANIRTRTMTFKTEDFDKRRFASRFD